MPRFQVITMRAYHEGFLVDAETEDEAKALRGEIVADLTGESWAEATVSVEEVSDDLEDIELP